MKKLLCLLLSLCLLCASIPAATAAKSTFTVMLYLCGTDLESNGGMATRNLKQIINSGITADGNVTVYVQTGGTKNWQVQGMADREAQRWVVTEEGIHPVENLGRVNMGDAASLADFISSGFENCPADRYGLVLWDHGSGAVGGICYDELTDDALYMPEIYEGLKAGCKGQEKDKPFTFVGFDACLMGAYEVAAHVEPFAEYMIGSEELEPGVGWSYDGWLPDLVKDPSMSMERLGKLIVDSFIAGTLAVDRTDYATLAVIDLSKFPALREAVESMGKALGNEIDGGNLKTISRLRQNVRSFGEMGNAASDMVDMTTFAEVFGRYDEAGAKKLKSALKEAVVYSRYTNNLTGVTGMSILVPFSTRNTASQYLSYYEKLNLSPEYIEFVTKMLGGISGGSYSFGTPSVSQQSIQSAQIDWFSQYANDPDSYQESAQSLWGQLYGTTDMTEGNESNFSLDSFLNSLFGDSGSTGTTGDEGNFNANYDASQSSLWGDVSQYDDSSFATDSGYGSGLWGSIWAGTSGAATGTGGLWDSVTSSGTDAQEVTVNTGDGDVALENPFAGTDSDYAYTVQLTQEQLDNLGSVEGNLMMDLSDPDFECYVELGYVQSVVTDWENGKIYGTFDGTWATLDGQMVCMYDQIANERYIRSLIPAKVNGEEMYVLVVFDQENPKGKVTGATEGYTEAGLPARQTIQLQEGDVVIPLYELLYWDEDGQQQVEPFEGDEIIVGADGFIPFAFSQVEGDVDYLYGFCLTDIYGDYEYTEFTTISF